MLFDFKPSNNYSFIFFGGLSNLFGGASFAIILISAFSWPLLFKILISLEIMDYRSNYFEALTISIICASKIWKTDANEIFLEWMKFHALITLEMIFKLSSSARTWDIHRFISKTFLSSRSAFVISSLAGIYNNQFGGWDAF